MTAERSAAAGARPGTGAGTGAWAGVDAVAARYQAARRLPSLTYGVLRDGVLAHQGSAGEPVAPGTQFRIGSITKTMTAVLVLQCRDEGRLDLDDPLGRFVPESGYAAATLRELLSHTSGMQSEPSGPWWERTDGGDFAALNAANDGTGRVFPAGVEHHYSNLGFALLGEAIARVRDTPWAVALHERVLSPLGLTRTTLLPEPPHAQGRSVHHLRGTLADEPHSDTGAMAPAGQLWSTIEDLARFAGFLRSGSPGVLAAGSLVEMRTPVLGGYGLGLQVLPFGDDPLVGHPGSMPGFQACAFVRVGSGEGVVALTNGTTGFVGDEFARALLTAPAARGDAGAAVEPWVPTRTVPGWAEEVLGVWHWGNSAFELRWHNQRLEFHDLARHRLAEQFVQAPDGRIVGVLGYHQGETLHVVRRDDGGVGHLECATFVYTRLPYDPAAPIPGGVPDEIATGPATPSSC